MTRNSKPSLSPIHVSNADTTMDKIKEAELEVKELKAELAKKETEVQTFQNKISLLQMDLERAEKRADEISMQPHQACFLPSNSIEQGKEGESDKGDSVKEALERKLQMLEKQLDDKEHDRKESIEKSRALELHAETHERKAKQIDAERQDFERRLDEMTKSTSMSRQSSIKH
ncbi:hypothetical protein BSLG_005853 [Batrachochytrium salamandrivorans]|nr:hypothetical protein BSLG_005853 [Batrachochytrium salamandrivorans]